MTCEKIRDELAVMALGEPAPPPPPLIEHLVACRACRQAYYEFLNVSARLAAAVSPVEPPAHLKAAVLSRAADARSERPPFPFSIFRRRSAGRGALVAAVAGLMVSAGIFGWSLRLENRLLETEAELRAARGEIVETWRAFSSAPAQYAGQILLEGRGAQAAATAEGLLYRRPGGWAALLRLEGLPPADGAPYTAWFLKDGAWIEGGPVLVDADGVGAALFYAFADEARFEAVRIVAKGALPGSPAWDEGTAFEGGAHFEEFRDQPREAGGAW